MPVFVAANRQLAAYKAQLDAQYNAADATSAQTDADKQRITDAVSTASSTTSSARSRARSFSARSSAIAQVSATRNLSVVVDKRIVIYGGQDITKDVETLFAEAQAIDAAGGYARRRRRSVSSTRPCSTDSRRSRRRTTRCRSSRSTQRQLFAPQVAQAKNEAPGSRSTRQFNKTITDKQDELLKPLVDATKAATADVAASKKLDSGRRSRRRRLRRHGHHDGCPE